MLRHWLPFLVFGLWSIGHPFRTASDACRYSIKDLAYLLGRRDPRTGEWKSRDRALLMRELDGEGRLDWNVVDRQMPLVWHREFHLAGLERSGLPRHAIRTSAISLVMLARKRMARVAISTRKQLAERKVRVG